MKNLRKLMILLTAGFILLASNACRETIEGAGEDIENAGDEVRDATN